MSVRNEVGRFVALSVSEAAFTYCAVAGRAKVIGQHHSMCRHLHSMVDLDCLRSYRVSLGEVVRLQRRVTGNSPLNLEIVHAALGGAFPSMP